MILEDTSLGRDQGSREDHLIQSIEVGQILPATRHTEFHNRHSVREGGREGEGEREREREREREGGEREREKERGRGRGRERGGGRKGEGESTLTRPRISRGRWCCRQ